MRDDGLVEPTVKQHIADGGALGDQMEKEEGEAIEPPLDHLKYDVLIYL